MKRYVVQWRMGHGRADEQAGYVGSDGWFTSDITKARVWKRRPVVYADERVIELEPDSGASPAPREKA